MWWTWKTPTASIRHQNALVTGASVVDGIGYEIAAKLLAEGATKVMITARKSEDLERAAKALVERTGVDSSAVDWFAADLSNDADVKLLADAAERMMGGVVDIVVNNAATEITGHATDIVASTIDNVIRVNLIAPQLLTTHLLPAMIQRGRGTFVYFSSILGLVPAPHCATYTSTKTGMRAYTHSMRYEFKESPVQFTCVSPTNVVGPHGQGARMEFASKRRAPEFYGTVTAEDIGTHVARAIKHKCAEVDCNAYVWTKLFWMLHELGLMDTMDRVLYADASARAFLTSVSDSKHITAGLAGWAERQSVSAQRQHLFATHTPRVPSPNTAKS